MNFGPPESYTLNEALSLRCFRERLLHSFFPATDDSHLGAVHRGNRHVLRADFGLLHGLLDSLSQRVGVEIMSCGLGFRVQRFGCFIQGCAGGKRHPRRAALICVFPPLLALHPRLDLCGFPTPCSVIVLMFEGPGRRLWIPLSRKAPLQVGPWRPPIGSPVSGIQHGI